MQIVLYVTDSVCMNGMVEVRRLSNGRETIQEEEKSFDFSSSCDSEAIRTLDPRLRRALLYPAELRNLPVVQCWVLPICVCKDSAFIPLHQRFFCIFSFCAYKSPDDACFASLIIEISLVFFQFHVSLFRRGAVKDVLHPASR